MILTDKIVRRTLTSKWLLLLGVWVLYFSFGLLTASIAPIAARLLEDLNMTHGELGFAMGAWQLMYIFSAIPAGILLDRVGPKISLTIAGVLIAASAFLRASAIDFGSFVLAVAVFGIGGPIISAGAPKAVISVFHGKSRGLAMGIYLTGPAVGGIIALSATNSILLPYFHDNWRSVLDLWGAISLCAAFFWLLIATSNESLRSNGANRVTVSGMQMSPSFLRKPAFVVIMFMSMLLFSYNHGLSNWLPTILQTYGFSAAESGFWAAAPTFVGIAASLLIPRSATYGRRFPIIAALSVCALISCLLLSGRDQFSLAIGLFLHGVVRASLMTILLLSLIEIRGIGERFAGAVGGMFFASGELGGLLGPYTLGRLYANDDGFTDGLRLLAIISAMMSVCAIYLLRRGELRDAPNLGSP